MPDFVTGATLAGSLLGADAASSAADTQAASANQASALQYKMWQEQQALQEPFRQGGVAANNQLMYLLGLSSPGGTQTEASLRSSLLPQYTTSPGTAATPGGYQSIGPEGAQQWVEGTPGTPGTVDQTGLNGAIQNQLAAQQQAQQAQNTDPNFGSLMRDFSMADFEQDPGYGFRLAEGQKALERQAAARGGLISGSALKAATRYGQDMGSQEYQNAYNRFQTNRANKLNPLQSMAGQGQTSANTLGNAAQSYANQAGEAYMGAGNARASGYMGQANAISGGIGQYTNYQQNQNMMNMFKPQQSYTPPFYDPSSMGY